MAALFVALLASLRATIRCRVELAAEILALRHQLAVLQRSTPRRPRLRPIDRLLWVLLSNVWPNWRQAAGGRARPDEHRELRRVVGELDIFYRFRHLLSV